MNGKNINGWFIGYVETKNNTYFFATNIQNEDDSSGSKAGEITLSILKDLGIYNENEGEKYGENIPSISESEWEIMNVLWDKALKQRMTSYFPYRKVPIETENHTDPSRSIGSKRCSRCQ